MELKKKKSLTKFNLTPAINGRWRSKWRAEEEVHIIAYRINWNSYQLLLGESSLIAQSFHLIATLSY